MHWRMTYKRYHIPQICEHEHHADVFTDGEGSIILLTAQECLEKITFWNISNKCWKYAPIKIERCFSSEPVAT